MTTARALYERLGYRRAPAFDIDVNVHYGIDAPRPWTALGYLKFLVRCSRRVSRAHPESERPHDHDDHHQEHHHHHHRL